MGVNKYFCVWQYSYIIGRLSIGLFVPIILGEAIWRYIIVVSALLCPSNDWTSETLLPFSIRWVEKLCLKVCGWACLDIFAFFVAFFIIDLTDAVVRCPLNPLKIYPSGDLHSFEMNEANSSFKLSAMINILSLLPLPSL